MTGVDVRLGPRGHRAVAHRLATGNKIAVTDPDGTERAVPLAADTQVRAVAVAAGLMAAVLRPPGAKDYTEIRAWELATLTERTRIETRPGVGHRIVHPAGGPARPWRPPPRAARRCTCGT
ncbi:hypothetical protein ABZ816_24080 [Actinosynnema sp. NPDC047251]|uniref:Uncharacterized protein n=1 Tax=Saccharothrix espanaensis (strain ATCC 51144 / DSM 44229 / JCM 9112 / NBRC 15066 / NRRL 15764) TaxID=1179773 RepID=K0K281_SACES|nr:hypothetical protein [Saccharothrix espanaensis]CCH32446.1 hypothetical protein BN6_51800 [Saccharothrix espanaensis DSM 44229]